jgi:arylsulfatase A-like enzyme/uncharacterized membrane protein
VTALVADSHLRNQGVEVLGGNGRLKAPERWIGAARFVVPWIIPALMGLYLKWYTMTTLGGFARATRSIGFQSLNLSNRLSFFRADFLVAFLLIPLALLVVFRFIGAKGSAILSSATTVAFLLLFAVQLRAMDEVGRYISLQMMWVALGWGLHEPGANAGYLSAKGIVAVVVAALFIAAAITWAFKRRNRPTSDRENRTWRIAGEMYVLLVAVVVAVGWMSSVPAGPYHESSAVRAVASLWKENAVDTGEFAAFDFDHNKGLQVASLPAMSTDEIIARYRDLAAAPLSERDARYFGKESGDNVLFFILETTPDEFLPVDDNMHQFPNLARLREKAFAGTRHYTTLPLTTCAVFSIFSGWYPMDSLRGAWGFSTSQIAPDFLSHLRKMGYDTAAFTPLGENLAEQDEGTYRAVGFENAYIPNEGVKGYDNESNWKTMRMNADLGALHLLESHIEQWTDSNKKFVAAFLPQIAHFPYSDSYPADSTENLRERGRAIIALEDSWLGELMNLLQQKGQLDKTIIVVVGDHGRRNRRENPNLRIGTIDETAFHVPMIVYAPRALDHTERVPWITSHIDLVPTVLDLLGVEGGRDSEQGTAIWNKQLANRRTFLLAQPTFGADGYASDGKFYMWNYFSDSIYINSQAVFDMSDFVPRTSPQAQDVVSNIAALTALEKAWHSHFADATQTLPSNSSLASSLR